jgi:2-dehydro-3-deoxygluconokinase
MQLNENARTALIALSSVGVRITPVNRQSVHTSHVFEMQSTSAETNVLNVSASLGLSTKVLTRFVKDSPIALFIKGDLRRRNIGFEGPDVPQGGPWGLRHQFNIADSGFGARGPRVHNDRAGEVGCALSADDYDLARLFEGEGCKILHLSGLVAALSEQAAACCLTVARFAKRTGTRISFDINHRASFWQGREQPLREAFSQIASLADILIGNEEDFQLALGIEGPPAGGVKGKIDGFKSMIERVRARYPSVGVCATTLRQVIDANRHGWGAILLAEDRWFVEPLREISILDRIGGGDGFVGGLLYAILRGWPAEDWVRFAWASGALAATSFSDYASPADEAQVWSIYDGNARVAR